jgi:hypothetical protein
MTDNQARNRPQIPVPPFPYTAEELCFESQGVSLCGTLTLPAASERFPGVVLVQGSGPHARDELVFGHPIFLVLADYLTRRGIAVLRYDKRGIGMSGGLYTESTVQDFADDALAALRFLKTKAQISQTGIVGHSEGGHVAMMVAAHSTDVDFIVSMAGMAVSGLDIHLSQLGLHLRNTKISEEIVGRELALARERIEILLAEPDNSAAAIKLLEFFRRNGKLPRSPGLAIYFLSRN